MLSPAADFLKESERTLTKWTRYLVGVLLVVMVTACDGNHEASPQSTSATTPTTSTEPTLDLSGLSQEDQDFVAGVRIVVPSFIHNEQDAEEFVETAKSLCQDLRVRDPLAPNWRAELGRLHDLSEYQTYVLAGAAVGVYCPELKARWDSGDRGD